MTLEGHQSEIWAMALSREGNFLVTAGHDREIRQWARVRIFWILNFSEFFGFFWMLWFLMV
jgi:hypothetical protein